MTAPRDGRYLAYIHESITLIERYANAGREAFLTDPMVSDALLHRLETLAEAAGQLSPEVKGRHPEVPWRDVTDFRNVAAHAYFDVELPRVWDIVTDDLPTLKAAVEDELRRLSG